MKTVLSKKSSLIKQNIQNHIAILIDSSGSMTGLTPKVKSVFERQISLLKDQSLKFDQETRVSVYTFSSNSDCLVWDMDVTRLESIPSYRVTGNTALMDCVKLACEDLQEIPQKYGDHAFIVYILTDGEENSSSISVDTFRKFLSKLPDNFTLAAMVPDFNGSRYLQNLGFSVGNIDKWDLSEKGIEEVGYKFEESVKRYMTSRASGQRSSSSFMVDVKNITQTSAKKNLNVVKNPKVVINGDVKAIQIRDLVERDLGIPYQIGRAYYELVKNEHIQAGKSIAIQNKKTGVVYEGREAREMIGLPGYEVKVSPGDYGEWLVFVQSTSVNRNIIPKQRVLVI